MQTSRARRWGVVTVLALAAVLAFPVAAVAYVPMDSPHGGGFSTCKYCHPVHGAPIVPSYRTKELCYVCHGSTSAEATDAAKSAINTQARFYDYAGQTAGSKHRNGYTTAIQKDCLICHRAHANMTTNPGLIRVQLSATVYASNTSTSPIGVGMCFACHGDTPSVMALNGGPSAYGVTAGDHNDAAYATAAHGPAVIYAQDASPAIQCLACHNKHASATDKLIDYRSSDTTSATRYAEAGLCFACHSVASTEAAVAPGYSAPFAWNDRDVQAEFARASHHPYASAGSGTSTTCVSCHNVHTAGAGSGVWDPARIADPGNVKGAVADSTTFCLACHDGTTPSASIGTDTLVPYSVGFATVVAPYFTGWDKAASGFEATSSGHYTTSGTKALCENCHDPHASDFARLTAWTRPASAAGLNAGVRENTSSALSAEENLCFQCHGNGTTGKQATGAKNVATAMALTYAHNSVATTGKHADTETAVALGSPNRHAECPDCHDPHVARTRSGSALHVDGSSRAGAALDGAYGTLPTWPAANWTAASAYTPGRLGVSSADYEIYLCVKCHSTNTAQPAGQTDVALQFNPSNYSAHNLTGRAQGMKTSFAVTPVGGTTTQTVSWAIPTQGVFRTGWTADSMFTCTGCHTNSTADAKGPHGSNAQWIIDPAYGRNWETVGLYDAGTYGMGYVSGTGTGDATDVICAKCHDLNGADNASWASNVHGGSSHAITHTDHKYCVNCHIKIPHGWMRPRLLGYATDPADYATTNNGGTSYPLVGFEVASHTLSGGQSQWSCTHCKTTGGKHTANLTAPWP